MNILLSKKFKQNGSIIVFEVLIIFVFSVVMLAVMAMAAGQFRILRSTAVKEQAFQIAESGINYYQWHLAHFPNDFKDGTGAAPSNQTNFTNPCYLHSYQDKDTNATIGYYCLEITPPLVGSTIVTIKSTAYAVSNPKIKRVITSRYGIPSLAKYSFLTNSDVWIGNTESVVGAMHSNGGIRFDGSSTGPTTSAKTTYTCQSYHGCSPASTKAGIWGNANQATKNLWSYPVPNVDFSAMTSNLASLKTSAQNGGLYLAPSNAQGYSLVFNSNGTISVYKVTSLRSTPTGYDVNNVAHNEDLDYNARTLLSQASIPSNGVIYIEDQVWVEGTVAGRAIVAAAKLPYNSSTAPSIIIPNNINYTVKDGTVSLGLLAQNNILVSYYSPNILNIDAALIAQNGSVQRFYYANDVKTSLTTYGTVASYGTWTWNWSSGNSIVSGYQSTVTTYDSNLLYAPPPSFPLASSSYQQISWVSN